MSPGGKGKANSESWISLSQVLVPYGQFVWSESSSRAVKEGGGGTLSMGLGTHIS